MMERNRLPTVKITGARCPISGAIFNIGLSINMNIMSDKSSKRPFTDVGRGVGLVVVVVLGTTATCGADGADGAEGPDPILTFVGSSELISIYQRNI
jgi:hypothetical protein